jgi:hypothetical protein
MQMGGFFMGVLIAAVFAIGVRLSMSADEFSFYLALIGL